MTCSSDCFRVRDCKCFCFVVGLDSSSSFANLRVLELNNYEHKNNHSLSNLKNFAYLCADYSDNL
jgi:hypothetical protein